jgi:uncharacterized membrane protein YhaH (DUF805 family)
MICKTCKHLVSNGDRYCTHCGTNNPNYIDTSKSHESHVFGEHKVYEKDWKRKSRRGTYFIAYFSMWKRMFDFRGTTKRNEFFTTLLVILVTFIPLFSRLLTILVYADSIRVLFNYNASYFYILYAALLVIPISSMIIRRIHDTGNSGVYVILLMAAPLAFFLSIEVRIVIWAILGMMFGYILTLPSHDNIYQVFDPAGYNEK